MDGRDNRHFAHINLEKISKCGCQKKTYYFYLHEELHKPIKLPKLNSSLGLQIKRAFKIDNDKMSQSHRSYVLWAETQGSPLENMMIPLSSTNCDQTRITMNFSNRKTEYRPQSYVNFRANLPEWIPKKPHWRAHIQMQRSWCKGCDECFGTWIQSPSKHLWANV